MKKGLSVFIIALFIFGFAMMFGCASTQTHSPPEDVEAACIQGKVWYRSPIDSILVPYPRATVNAWRAGTNEGLAKSFTDNAGNYCIEIPKGNYSVDLRVWGAMFIEGTTYLCQGSVANIELGSTSKKCGEDCQEINITTGCTRRVPGRRH
jgi:hypothetical protein